VYKAAPGFRVRPPPPVVAQQRRADDAALGQLLEGVRHGAGLGEHEDGARWGRVLGAPHVPRRQELAQARGGQLGADLRVGSSIDRGKLGKLRKKINAHPP